MIDWWALFVFTHVGYSRHIYISFSNGSADAFLIGPSFWYAETSTGSSHQAKALADINSRKRVWQRTIITFKRRYRKSSNGWFSIVMSVFRGVYFVTYYGHHRNTPSFAYKKTSPKPMGMMEMFA